jgi:hypothetical protein
MSSHLEQAATKILIVDDRHLQGLSSLRELILWNTRVTERGVAELQSHLPECGISTSAF